MRSWSRGTRCRRPFKPGSSVPGRGVPVWSSVSACCAALALLAGCGSTPEKYAAPPMPDDLAWRQVPVVQTPEGPVERPEPEPAPWERRIGLEERDEVRVSVPAGGVVSLMFRADEQIVEAVLGDQGPLPPEDKTAPWLVERGDPGTTHPMVHVRVTKPGLKVGLIVTTTKRVYAVDLRSVASAKTRLVRWEEPPPPPKAVPRLLPDPLVPASYHLGYLVCPGDQGCPSDAPVPVWRPHYVVDNGAKTYIVLPRHITVLTAPMLRLLGPTGPQLANPRRVDHVIVLDHLIDRAELRLGSGEAAEVVTITRGPARRINCPGDPACPDWPTTPDRPGMARQHRE
jgi:hypothetical protein